MSLSTGLISGSYTNIWVDKTDVRNVSSGHHIRVVHIAPLNSHEHVPNQTTYVKTICNDYSPDWAEITSSLIT